MVHTALWRMGNLKVKGDIPTKKKTGSLQLSPLLPKYKLLLKLLPTNQQKIILFKIYCFWNEILVEPEKN